MDFLSVHPHMGTCDQAIRKDTVGRPDAAFSQADGMRQKHEKNDKTADSDEGITNLL
jgi:hypothetical protein